MKYHIKFFAFIIFLILLLILSTGCTQQRYSETRSLLGTEITIIILYDDMNDAKEAANTAFLEIEKIEQLMSSYDKKSELSRLNQEKEIHNPDQRFVNVIKESIRYFEESDGAFDITVQPLLNLYTKSFSENQKPPTDDQIKEYLNYVDSSKIKLDYELNKVSIGENQELTLGGIAKGYAVDRAISVIELYGIENALINAGGDIKTIGQKENKMPWRIALQNPRDKKDYIAMIDLSNNSIATSGDYERFFDDSKKAHHIMNPKTGKSATELISVTVVADEAIDADAYATAVFVLGKEKGKEFCEHNKKIECLIITENKNIIRSTGFEKFEV